MAKKSDHVSPLLEQLHWLPVHKRIDLKHLTIIYNFYATVIAHLHMLKNSLSTKLQWTSLQLRFSNVNKVKN